MQALLASKLQVLSTQIVAEQLHLLLHLTLTTPLSQEKTILLESGRQEVMLTIKIK